MKYRSKRSKICR